VKFDPKPLRVVCNSCGTSAETWDYSDPDSALICNCCPLSHNHAGLGCRTITIYATAHLTLFDLNELMEMDSAPPVLDVSDSCLADSEFAGQVSHI